MKSQFSYAQPSRLATTVAAAAATFIAVCLLSAVTILFQRDGTPFEHVAAAERACTHHDYVSEREACMRDWLAARSATYASR